MIPQPDWTKIFAEYAAQGGFEFHGQQDLCHAGLAFIDQLAYVRRMRQIELIGMGQSKTHMYWVRNTIKELGIDENDYLEVKRIVFAVQGSQGAVGWEE